MNWLKKDDKNTTFFHKHATQRRSINNIKFLEDEEGRVKSNQGTMVNIAKNFFNTIFLTRHSISDLEHILSGVYQSILPKDNAFLTTPFTREEVYGAIKDMGPLKAPEQDGFPTLFYQKY